jgi:hypothetical protein
LKITISGEVNYGHPYPQFVLDQKGICDKSKIGNKLILVIFEEYISLRTKIAPKDKGNRQKAFKPVSWQEIVVEILVKIVEL